MPKTRDQPEKPNSKRSRHCGNNASTGLSRVPPTNRQMRRPTSEKQDAPPLVAATPTGSTRTNSPKGVRAGRPRPPIAQPTVVTSQRPEHEDARHTTTAGRSDRSCDSVLAATGRSPLTNPALIDQGRAPPGHAARVLAPLRAAPQHHASPKSCPTRAPTPVRCPQTASESATH
jgi:hypothetical protein